MHTIILVTHIVTMVSSMALMCGALVAGLLGKSAATHVASAGMVAAILGVGSGTLLLLSHPLTVQCAALAAYLVVVSALYTYGFGAGSAKKARLIRTKAMS